MECPGTVISMVVPHSLKVWAHAPLEGSTDAPAIDHRGRHGAMEGAVPSVPPASAGTKL